jgi:hypothetical protein
MGASSWRYYAAYQSDPEAALQQLRRDVFERGEYSFGFGGFAGPGGPFAGGPFAATPGVPEDLIAGLPPQLQLLNAAARLAGTDDRVARAAMTGDYAGLTDDQRQAAEQLRPFFQMAQAQLTQGGTAEDFGADEDDEEDDGFEDGFGPGPFRPGQRPETIEELLEMVAEDGTHSVLDIEQTGPTRGFGVAAPMPLSRIRQHFGTEEPTREQIEESWGDAAEGLDRWQAYYVAVYREGKPHEYAFIGCSGD